MYELKTTRVKSRDKCLAVLLALSMIVSLATVPSALFAEEQVVPLAAAAAPQIIRQPADTQTYAKSATARIYTTASSTDGGYLTYEWYQSQQFALDGSDLPATNAEGQPANPAALTKTLVGTDATLEVTTPSTAGYYYYWAEITNHKAGDTPTTTRTNFSLARVVDRALAPVLMNGDFEDNTTTWPLNNVGGKAGEDAVQFVPALYPEGPASGYFVPYWDTTHFLDTGFPANTFRYGKNIQFMGAGYYGLNSSSAFKTAGNHYVELAPTMPSTIFQEIATVPGKVYEWSYDQAGRTGADSATGNQLIAIVIGKAINSSADYVGVTNRTQSDYTFNFPAQNNTGVNIPEYAGTKTWSYPYGYNDDSYFMDIVNSLGKTLDECLALADSGTPAVTTYNGSKYYIAFSNCPAAHADVHNSGVYTVPEGQGTTVFGYVAIDVSTGAGGALDNIVFVSGASSSVDGDISYSGEAKIEVETKTGFAYTLAEVRGSSIIALPGQKVSYGGSDITGNPTYHQPQYESVGGTGLGDGNWYTGFADAGTLVFTDLTPGKTYRVIGIPVGAISAGLDTNQSAADVLDDGYYDDVTLSAATDAGSTDISNIRISYVNSLGQIEVLNSNSGVEYALLSEASADTPNTTTPISAWQTGGGELVYSNLATGQNYYLVARPLGYTEVTYATAQPYKVVLPLLSIPEGQDLAATNVTRTSGTQIDIVAPDLLYTYAVYDPADGRIIDEQDGSLGAVSFTGLAANTAYQVVQRYTADGFYLKGVRVYPYATDLDSDNALAIDYAARTVTSYSGGAVSGSLEYGITHNTGDSEPASYTQASGTSTISLAGEIGSAGKVIYRVVRYDGYAGAAVQPTEASDVWAAQPAAPVASTDYTVGYVAEAITVADATALDWYDSSGNTALAGTFTGTGVTFASLGWSGTGYDFKLRKAATSTSFASEFTSVTLAARPAAPQGFSVVSSGTDLTISGLVSGNVYEYRKLTDSWAGASSVDGSAGSVTVPYNPATDADYQLRIQAIDATTPASYAATVSSPLFIAPINFGSVPYSGTSPASEKITISNISGAPIDIDAIALVGGNAADFDLNVLSGTQTVPINGDHDLYTITPTNPDAGTYTTTIDVTYNGTQHALVDVSLTITKVSWSIAATDFGAPVVTENSILIPYTVSGDPVLSWSTGTAYVPDAGGGIDTKTFSPLSAATTYTISVKALGDNNHYESASVSLPPIYTPYATPAAASVVYIDFASETLKFVSGVIPALYTVRLGSATGAVVGNGDSLTAAANAGTVNLVVSRNGSGNYPASEYSAALSAAGKAAAPSPTTVRATTTGSGDGAIVLVGAFQYRAHSDFDETSNWLPASGSVNVSARTYDVRLPNTATAFGSRIAEVTVGVKATQVLTVDDPGTLTYGTDTSFSLSVTGVSGGGTTTFTRTEGVDSVATVAADGTLAIFGAGSIKVRVANTGDGDNNAAISAERTIVIAQRDINQSYVTVSGINASYPYTGSQIAPVPTGVADSGANATITAGDYAVTYGANVNVAGGGSVILTGTGNYTGTKTVNFAISKATPSYGVPSGLTAVYGSTLDSVSLAVGTGAGSFSWVEPATTLVGDVGSRPHDVTFTPSDTANYNTVTPISASILVTAAPDSIAIAQPTPALVYGDTPYQLQLASAGLGTGVPLSYVKTEGADTFATVSSTGLITITGAGTIKVQVTRPAAGNYQQAQSAELEIVIGKRNINQAAVTVSGIDASYPYTGFQITPLPPFTVADGGAAITGSDYDIGYGANLTVAGGGSVILTGKGNYTGIRTVNFAIDKATPAAVTFPTTNAVDYSATGSLAAVPLSAGAGAGSFAWVSPNTKPVVANSGYVVRFTPADAANYDWSGYSSETGYNAADGSFTRVVSLVVNAAEDPAYSVPAGLSAVTGATLDRVALPSGWTWDDATPDITVVGAVGTQSHAASYTPADVNYLSHSGVLLAIEVTAAADKTALQDRYDTLANTFGGVGLPDIHEENYTAAEVAALRAAEAAATPVLADALATQSEVDGALAVLDAAYAALVQDHPVLSHSHAGGLSAFGQEVIIRIKGDFGDVDGFILNGQTYTLAPVSPTQLSIRDSGGAEVGTLSRGSAVVTLSAAFVDRLANGTHILEVEFTDLGVSAFGTAELVVNRVATGDTTKPDIVPLTGDEGVLYGAVAIAALSVGLLLLVVSLWRRSRERRGRHARG